MTRRGSARGDRRTWVVVGAGSAGCVVARRLLDAGDAVVLVESGPSLLPGEVPAELSGLDSFAALVPERLHGDLVATRVAGRAPVPYLRGRGVGGSSAVNAMVALDADPATYRSWGWDDVGEARSRVLLPVEAASPDELGVVDRALLAAADDARPVPLNRHDGRRVTSAEAYLWPVLTEPGLIIRSDATVDVVTTDVHGRVDGVRLADGEVIASDHVVLCAGAIHSPAILLRSDLGIDGVGEHLQDHPAAAIALDLAHSGEADDARGLAIGAVLERDPVQILAVNHLGDRSPLAMLLVSHMRPRSATGTVRLRTSDPYDHPIVDFDLFTDPDDVAVLRGGVRLVLELLDRPPFRSIVERAYIDDVGTTIAALDTDAAIDAWLLDRGADYVHASGTCGMGRVVDAAGRVPPVPGLHVCDASVFPTIPDVNTHLPTTVLAERLVARWT